MYTVTNCMGKYVEYARMAGSKCEAVGFGKASHFNHATASAIVEMLTSSGGGVWVMFKV